jgi:hypothetical protein
MSISSIGTNNVANVNVASSITNSSTARASSIPPPGAGAAATVNVSTPGQFFSQLQSLSQSNPSEFKTVAASLAQNFEKAASSTSGPQAKFLSHLADQFSQAAQTGQLESSQGQGNAPAAGAHHHHHHHGGGGGGGGAVQGAFQSAMGILNDALSGSSTSTSSSTSAVTTPTTTP